MEDSEILDSLFREAVTAIDAGDIPALEQLLATHPRLIRDRLNSPGAWLRDKVGDAVDGFFQRPYLLWFVAEDPVRNGKLPENIGQVTRTIIWAAKRDGVDDLGEQLDYALRLVSWSPVARECNVQIDLIDVLADAGASLDGHPEAALVNGHLAAAAHLMERGSPVTLAAALCVGRWDDVRRLAKTANAREKQVALVLAALNGKADALRTLIDLGVDLNAYSTDIYTHATALHHAVSSGSLDSVRTLVEAGADLSTEDTAWHATPLGWANYCQGQDKGADIEKRYAEIAAYLRDSGAH